MNYTVSYFSLMCLAFWAGIFWGIGTNVGDIVLKVIAIWIGLL